jgi:hypothetical protein
VSEDEKNGTTFVVPLNIQRMIIDEAVRQLPAGASAQEKQRAVRVARTAVRESEGATKPELIDTVNLAVACVAEDVRRRLRREGWRNRAPQMLPWGADDDDKRAARKTALEILNDIPLAASDSQVQSEIREALQPLCEGIENSQRIDGLIAYGLTCVSGALSDLYSDDSITCEDWLDVELRDELQETVTEELSQGGADELDGSETREEVKEIVEQIVSEQFDDDEPAED